MPNYVTKISEAAFACTHLWRSGTTDLIGSTSLLSTGTPTTNANGDAFDESNGATPRTGAANQLGNASGNATDYFTIPASVFTEMLAAGAGSVVWMGKRNASLADLALLNGGYELMCGAGAGGVNSFEFSPSMRSPLFGSTNHMAIVITNAAGVAKGVEFLHSATTLDGQWHQFGFGWDATHLYLYFDGAIVGTLAITAATDLPATAFNFGMGERLFNNVAQNYKCPWTYQYTSTHTTALTAAQLQSLAATFNGRTGAKVYYGSRLTRLTSRPGIKPILSLSDSNMIRSTTDPVGPGKQQGFGITLDRLIRGATGNRLVGRHVGASDPLNDGYVDGVYANLLGNVGNVPNNSADPWPVGLYAHDLTEYNRVTTGYNQGFSMASCYLASGSAVATTAVGIFMDATDADWPLDTTATTVLKIRRATFSAGSGTYTLQAKKVSDNSTITANDPFSTNTGADTFTTDDTITIGSNLAANYGEVRVFLGAATGPIAFGPATVLNANRNSGYTTGVIWAYGGQPTGKIMVAWKALKTTAEGEGSTLPFDRVNEIIQCVLTHVGNLADPTLCIHIAELQNDRNDTGPSYDWNGVTATFDASGSNTGNKRIGCQQNLQAIVNMFRDAWLAWGYNRDNLFFLFGPYHEIGDPSNAVTGPSIYNMENQLQRAVMNLCDADTTYQTCFAIDGPETVPYATMDAASGYDSGGAAHMNLAGYRLLGTEAGAVASNYVAVSGNPPGVSGPLRKLLLGV